MLTTLLQRLQVFGVFLIVCAGAQAPLLIDQFYQYANNPSCKAVPAQMGSITNDFVSARVPMAYGLLSVPTAIKGYLPKSAYTSAAISGVVLDTQTGINQPTIPRYVYSFNTTEDIPAGMPYGDNSTTQAPQIPGANPIGLMFVGTTRLVLNFTGWERPPKQKASLGGNPPDTSLALGIWLFTLEGNNSSSYQRMVVFEASIPPQPIPGTVQKVRLEINNQQPWPRYCMVVVLTNITIHACTAAGTVIFDEWVHVSVSFDNANIIIIAINGNIVSKTLYGFPVAFPVVYNATGPSTGAATNLIIGGTAVADEAVAEREGYMGAMADFRIYRNSSDVYTRSFQPWKCSKPSNFATRTPQLVDGLAYAYPTGSQQSQANSIPRQPQTWLAPLGVLYSLPLPPNITLASFPVSTLFTVSMLSAFLTDVGTSKAGLCSAASCLVTNENGTMVTDPLLLSTAANLQMLMDDTGSTVIGASFSIGLESLATIVNTMTTRVLYMTQLDIIPGSGGSIITNTLRIQIVFPSIEGFLGNESNKPVTQQMFIIRNTLLNRTVAISGSQLYDGMPIILSPFPSCLSTVGLMIRTTQDTDVNGTTTYIDIEGVAASYLKLYLCTAPSVFDATTLTNVVPLVTTNGSQTQLSIAFTFMSLNATFVLASNTGRFTFTNSSLYNGSVATYPYDSSFMLPCDQFAETDQYTYTLEISMGVHQDELIPNPGYSICDILSGRLASTAPAAAYYASKQRTLFPSTFSNLVRTPYPSDGDTLTGPAPNILGSRTAKGYLLDGRDYLPQWITANTSIYGGVGASGLFGPSVSGQPYTLKVVRAPKQVINFRSDLASPTDTVFCYPTQSVVVGVRLWSNQQSLANLSSGMCFYIDAAKGSCISIVNTTGQWFLISCPSGPTRSLRVELQSVSGPTASPPTNITVTIQKLPLPSGAVAVSSTSYATSMLAFRVLSTSDSSSAVTRTNGLSNQIMYYPSASLTDNLFKVASQPGQLPINDSFMTPKALETANALDIATGQQWTGRWELVTPNQNDCIGVPTSNAIAANIAQQPQSGAQYYSFAFHSPTAQVIAPRIVCLLIPARRTLMAALSMR